MVDFSAETPQALIDASFSSVSAESQSSQSTSSYDNSQTIQLTPSQLNQIVQQCVKQLTPSTISLPPENRLDGIGNEGISVQTDEAQGESINPVARKRGRPKKVEVVESKEPTKKRGRQLGASKVLTSSPERGKLYEKSLNQKPTNKKTYKVQFVVSGKENQAVSELPLKDVSETLVAKKSKKDLKKPLQTLQKEKNISKKSVEVKSNLDPVSTPVLPSRIRKTIKKIKQEKLT